MTTRHLLTAAASAAVLAYALGCSLGDVMADDSHLPPHDGTAYSLCEGVEWGTVTPDAWDVLIAEGWQGRQSDGTDNLIYPPHC